jgi:hypothetical protein
MDERNKQIACKVIAIMYFLTFFAIAGVILYRQFVLRQELNEYEDFAIILTFNSLFLMSALLYFGAIPIRRLKVTSILIIYVVLVVAGSIFTYIYYHIIQSPGLSLKEMSNKFLIIVAITGIIMGFWVLLSILGKKRLDKELK